MVANKELNSVFGNSKNVVVANDAIPAFTPVKLTFPIPVVFIPTKSVLKELFIILISWSFVNASSGVNKRFLVPEFKICVS